MIFRKYNLLYFAIFPNILLLRGCILIGWRSGLDIQANNPYLEATSMCDFSAIDIQSHMLVGVNFSILTPDSMTLTFIKAKTIIYISC